MPASPARTAALRARERRALGHAAAIAALYFAVTAGYVAVSDSIASAASSVSALVEVQAAKGLAFAVVSALAIGALGCHLLRSSARSRAELEAAREALADAERRTTAGLLAASVAHDVNNVLAVLSSGLYELGADPSEPERREILADMTAALERGTQLTRRLSRAAKHTRTDARELDVVEIAADAVDLSRHYAAARDRSITIEHGGPTRARVDPTRVHQIVTNLVLNALEASPPRGRVLVRVGRDGEHVTIEVHDEGPGVPEDLREAIFDPFFTTKPDGTGLGMLSVRACAEMHEGRVEVGRSSELGGARVLVCLRRAR